MITRGWENYEQATKVEWRTAPVFCGKGIMAVVGFKGTVSRTVSFPVLILHIVTVICIIV